MVGHVTLRHQWVISLLVVALAAHTASALDDAHWPIADAAIERGIAYLRHHQNEDGSWSPRPGPAITAMVVSVMLDRPNISSSDPDAQRALAYILSKCQDDGGIHDGILQNYNTAICLSALARAGDQPRIASVITKGHDFLRKLQWTSQTDPQGNPVQEEHPFYGGAGYGKHGRPDMSNTQIMLQGLYDSGMSCDDPIFLRAMAFITRCQGTKLNTQFGDKIAADGGFIYATSIDKDHIGTPQSMADGDALPGSRLRTYGSMTYAGFKSYLYARLSRDDPRVVDAYNWIRRNYTVGRNPGLPEARQMQGYYYYLMTMSRALDAWGSSQITTPDGKAHDWANDLIHQLHTLQRRDGSWVNTSSRWMEKDPVLVTAYALIALTHALK